MHGFSFKPAGRRNTHEKREEYCLAALILFTPFSCLDRATFLGQHATFQDAFAAAQNEGRICPEGVAYLRNVEIMWQHKDAAQKRTVEHHQALADEAAACRELQEALRTRRATRTTLGQIANDDSDDEYETGSDTSDIDYSAFDALATIAARTDLGTIPSAFFEPPTIEAMPHVPGRTHAWVATHSSKIATGLTRPLLAAAPIFNDGNDDGSDSDGGSDNDDRGSESCNGSDSDDDNAGMAAVTSPAVRPMEVREIYANYKNACNDCIFGAEPATSTSRSSEDGLPAAVHFPINGTKCSIPICATINEISRLFKFTEDQHRAFCIPGRAFLAQLAHEDTYFTMPDAEMLNMQRTLLLHGMGGTGKSHVIHGLRALAFSWTRPSAVGTFAVTGVAAINIGGETLARLLFSFEKRGSMTEALRTRWLCLRLVVLDEMSMAKWGDLRRLDLFLRALTERNVPFGGVVIVLAGDFYQLGPIGCPYLFVPPGTRDGNASAGYHLYRTITDDAVVVLSQVLRTTDTSFTDFQDRLRLGNWDEDLEKKLNTRAGAQLVPPPADAKNKAEKYYCPVLVTKNRTRSLLEAQRAHAICAAARSDNKELPILLRAHMSTKRRSPSLSEKEKTYLYGLPDSMFNKAPPATLIYPGAWSLSQQTSTWLQAWGKARVPASLLGPTFRRVQSSKR